MDYSNYPHYRVNKDSVVLDGTGSLSFINPAFPESLAGYAPDGDVPEDNSLGVDRIIQYLRDNPEYASRLLSTKGHLYYAGKAPGASDILVIGVKEIKEDVKSVDKDGYSVVYSQPVLVGNNLWGRALEAARDAYREELVNEGMFEEMPRSNVIVCDYTREGETDSVIASYEADMEQRAFEGEDVSGMQRYLHTDYYKPKKNVFNSSRSGVTGFRDRPLGEDVPWKTFVCPFGIGYPHKFRTATSAEASFLYEKALRGELDWDVYIADALTRKGDDGRPKVLDGVSPLEADRLASDMRNQFAWMRDQIMNNNDELRKMLIVAESAFPVDGSFGMSVFDYKYAPSPAMVLARYIYNPLLLSYNSTLCTALALGYASKEEPRLFVKDNGSMTILVDGSDCIGGRVPGTTSQYKRVSVPVIGPDGSQAVKNGKKMWRHELRKVPQMMSDDQKESDYQAFRTRMNEILQGVSTDVPITFVTGGRMGIPDMVNRYVLEMGGNIYRWDALTGGARLISEGSDLGSAAGFDDFPDVSVVQFSRDEYRLLHPVFASRTSSVTISEEFPLVEAAEVLGNRKYMGLNPLAGSAAVSPADAAKIERYNRLSESEKKEKAGEYAGQTVLVSRTVTPVSLSMADCLPSSLALFTRGKDAYLQFVLQRASLAASSGMPVIHSVDLLSSAAQRDILRVQGSTIAASLLGNVHWDDNIFPAVPKTDWRDSHDLPSTYSFGIQEPDGSFRSFLTEPMPSSVSVGGGSYNTVYDAFRALVVVYLSGSDTRKVNSFADMIDNAPDSVINDAIRTSVHLFALNDGYFQSILDGSGDGDIICREPANVHDGRLFVDEGWIGENRFGIALKAERGPLRQLLRSQRAELENINSRLSEGNEASRRKVSRLRGEGLLIDKSSLQDRRWLDENADNAVFLTGTLSRGEMVLGTSSSYDEWTFSALDPGRLSREVASSKMIITGYDAEQNPKMSQNRYVFLFPTDEKTAARREQPRLVAGSTDLTDLRRTLPNGKEIQCAFGIPVKHNPKFNLTDDAKDGYSFYRDRDAGVLIDNIILADSRARKVALENGLSLSTSVYEVLSRDRSTVVESRPSLSEQFLPTIWGPTNRYDYKQLWYGRMGCDDFNDLKDFLVCVSEPSEQNRNRYDVIYKSLFAPKELLNGLSDGSISPQDFARRYRDEVLEKNQNVILSREGLVGIMQDASRRGMRFCIEGDAPEDGVSALTVLTDWLKSKGFICQESSTINMYRGAGRNEAYVRNPHESTMCRSVMDRYLSCLTRGRDLPLNCFVLPHDDYMDHSKDEEEYSGKRLTESDFLSDLRFVLRLANMTAVATGRKLYIPYNPETKMVDLGPNIPEKYMKAADAVIRDFIGDESRRSLIRGRLPQLTPVSGVEGTSRRPDTNVLRRSDLFIRATPNDLVALFGPFLFNDRLRRRDIAGGLADEVAYALHGYVHSVGLSLSDGSFFTLYDDDASRFTHKQLRDFVSYASNPSTVWNIDASPGANTAHFVNVLDSYIVRSKLIKVEYRLVTTDEQLEWDKAHPSENVDDQGIGADGEKTGYIWLPSSNAKLQDIRSDDHMIMTREMSAMELRTAMSGNDYPGWVDAADGFDGFVQWRYAEPGGEFGEWRVLDDFSLARDVVLLMTHRTYNDPNSTVPKREFVEACFCNLAIRDMGSRFLNMNVEKMLDHVMPKPKITRSDAQPLPKIWFGRLNCPDFSESEDFLVCISDPGRKYRGRYDIVYESLYAPSRLLEAYGRGRISSEDFANMYRKNVLDKNKDVILSDRGILGLIDRASKEGKRLCIEGYGSPGMVSVRTVFADWMKENGYECRESVADRESLKGRELRSINISLADGQNGPLDISYDRPFAIRSGGRNVAFETAQQGAVWLLTDVDSIPSGEKRSLRKSILGGKTPLGLDSIRDYIVTKWRPTDGMRAYNDALSRCIRESFLQNPLSASSLISTGDVFLTCVSSDGVENKAASDALMSVRNEIRKDPSIVQRSGGSLTGISFEEGDGGYAATQDHNAKSSDVDMSIIFATEFSAPEIRQTVQASKSSGKGVVNVILPVRKGGGLNITTETVALAVNTIWSSINRRFAQGDPIGINVCGNTADVLARSGIGQNSGDLFVSLVMDGLLHKGMDIVSLRSGGQSGIEESAAVAGVVLGLRTTVHSPKNWVMRDPEGRDVSLSAQDFAARFADEIKCYDSLKHHLREYYRNDLSPRELDSRKHGVSR